MEIKRAEFVNNFSEQVEDIDLLKTIYETAFMEGVNYALYFNTDKLDRED